MTCYWIGRFWQVSEEVGNFVRFVTRVEEKKDICGTSRANDATVRHALIQRFAKHDMENGKGTKNNKDFFYGFKADIWSAYAVAVTWIDKHGGQYA